ncbi:MAG: 2-hydroxyacid dehydrogenase [Clostridia bacterium]|nr:2-hydroxyacid dehydrogenase [Clostridia bacterium]
MAKYKAYVSAPLDAGYLKKLEAICDVTYCGWSIHEGLIYGEDESIEAFHEADIIITNYDLISRRVMEACPDLKLIACCRGNPVNVDRAAATALGIPVVYSPGRNANSVAEFLLGATLGLIRNIPRSYREVRGGRFLGAPKEDIYQVPERDDIVWGFNMGDQSDSPFIVYEGYEMFHKTFGMVGYGAVGRRLAKFLKAMDVRVLIYDPYLPPSVAESEGVEMMSLEEMLPQCDFVSLHCKVTEETKGMFGAREFALMKTGAVFINTARGVIVQQKALLDALAQKKISGAVLDVFWEEPMPANHPLLQMDNVVITPHIAGTSKDIALHQSIMIIGDVERFVKGEPLQYVFNKEVLQ